MKPLPTTKRLLLLFKRFLAARRLIFTFMGTSKTELPTRVRIGKRFVSLYYPGDSGYLSDIINVWLDGEYGIGKLELEPKTVVDIGANIGLFTLWVWHHVASPKGV